MEKLSSSLARHHDGVIKLPPGFRFHPTDEELVVQYLRRKVFSCPLPASIIPEIDLAKFNPWDLPGGCEQERYFFAVREAKYPNGNRPNRATSCGYWKATGKDRMIVATKFNQVVGMKKSLVFYKGKAPKGSRTDWIMHEYRLASTQATARACIFPQRKNSTHTAAVGAPARDWVLCRIFLKKRAKKMDLDVEEEGGDEEEGRRAIGFIDFLGRRPSSPSASDSSCVTEATDESSINGEATMSNP